MLGYMASFEQFHPTDLLEYCKQAEKAGFEGGFRIRSFSSLDAAAGSIGVRLGLAGCARRIHQSPLWHRRDPSGLSLPSSHSGAGGRNARSDVPGAFRAWTRRG